MPIIVSFNDGQDWFTYNNGDVKIWNITEEALDKIGLYDHPLEDLDGDDVIEVHEMTVELAGE